MAAILLDLHGVLLDGSDLFEPYRQRLATTLLQGYGGTLEARLRGHDAGWARYRRLAENPDTTGPVREKYRAMDRAHMRTVFEVAGVPPPDDEEILRLSRRLEREVLGAVARPYPDVRKSLETLHREGYAIHLITNSNEDAAVGALDGMGIRDAFTELFTRDSQDATKRDPRYWEAVAERLGTPPTAWTVVDDNTEYLCTPAQWGATCVLVDRSGSAPDDPAVPVAATLRHLGALPPFLAARRD